MDPEKEIKEDNPLKQIRTFQGDVAEALRRQNESLVSIQQREHIKRGFPRDESGEKVVQRRKEVLLFALGSAVLISLSIIGVWFAYEKFMEKGSAPPIPAPVNRLVTPTSVKSIEITATTRLPFIDIISSSMSDVGSGELRHLVIRERSEGLGTAEFLTPEKFLSILESQAPGSLVRAFSNNFMIGGLGRLGLGVVSDKPSVFIIIRLSSFENAFAGMLLWERNLARDLGPLFGTADLLLNIGPEPVFEDITTRNKDARVLRLSGPSEGGIIGSNREVVLLYSFYDNEMLIITDNLETFRSLIDRLNREKLSR